MLKSQTIKKKGSYENADFLPHRTLVSHLLNQHLLDITDSNDVTLNQPLPCFY